MTDKCDEWDFRTNPHGVDGNPDVWMDKREGSRTRRVELPSLLPSTPKERKDTPIFSGVLNYFPLAIAEIARVSKAGNDQHNPGEPMHWAREKSTDQEDCVARHLIEHGKIDVDGQRHTAKMAWRALAMLELELEAVQRQSSPPPQVYPPLPEPRSLSQPSEQDGHACFSGAPADDPSIVLAHLEPLVTAISQARTTPLQEAWQLLARPPLANR